MNLKDAKRLKPGAIVREAWGPTRVEGMVLSKQHVKEDHVAKTLCQKKKERYDIVVHWFDNPPAQYISGIREPSRSVVQIRQNWEIMVKIHAT
jgi:hypothetical protein